MDRVAMWPPFGVRVRTPRLELRAVDPDLAFAVADLAAAGVHDPATMPFNVPWTDAAPPDLQRNSVRHFFDTWSNCQPEDWRLPFAVFEDATLVGIQDVMTREFPVLRQFVTGSWVGKAFQGRGIGREMRAAVLHLGFAGLDATRALTAAFSDNAASLAVTRALGYRPAGSHWAVRRGEPAEQLDFVMERADWEAHRRSDIEIDGVDDDLRAFLGLR